MKINARLLLSLYPRAWRERYGAELRALVEESNASGARVACDLALNALREQLRAGFVDVPARRRQIILANFLAFGLWAGGTLTAALISLALPDFVTDDDVRAVLSFSGTMASIGIMIYLFRFRRFAEAGSTEFPRLTPALTVLFMIAGVATAVVSNLHVAHQYHLGRQALADVWFGAVARGFPFVLIGLGITARLWPELFRKVDSTAPGQSPGMGLGA